MYRRPTPAPAAVPVTPTCTSLKIAVQLVGVVPDVFDAAVKTNTRSPMAVPVGSVGVSAAVPAVVSVPAGVGPETATKVIGTPRPPYRPTAPGAGVAGG